MQLNQLNFHHLFYFWRVAKLGHLTRAAEELHTSQSAVSAQIRQLEERMGDDLFAREGRPAGTLDAGRHTLQGAGIPFLQNLIDTATGGDFLLSEIFFVKRTPFPMPFGGSLGHMIDPMTAIRVRGRCHGDLLMRIENPEQLIYGYFGMGKYQENPDIFSWLTDMFFMTVKSTLGKLAKEQRRTLLRFDLVALLGER